MKIEKVESDRSHLCYHKFIPIQIAIIRSTAIQNNALQYTAVQYNALQYNTIQYNIILVSKVHNAYEWRHQKDKMSINSSHSPK